MAAAAATAAAATSSIAAVSSTCYAKHRAGPLLPSLPILLKQRGALRISGSSISVGKRKTSLVCVRATASSEESNVPDASKQLQELFEDLKEKYDGLENKSQVWIYGGGALLALWFSSIIIGAVNSIPLLPKILELVGLGYSGWFVYRYLLFKSSRKQLAEDIEVLKLKVTGVPKSAFMTEDDE